MSELNKRSDRDLLIETVTNVKNLCGKFESFKEDNKDAHTTVFKLLGDQANGKVSNKLFFFTIGLIVLAIVSLTAYASTIKNDVTKNTVHIERFEMPLRGL